MYSYCPEYVGVRYLSLDSYCPGVRRGQVSVFIKRHCTNRSVSCRRRIRRIVTCGTPGMATQVRPADPGTGVPPSPAGPPCCSLLHFSHLSSLSIIIGMPNRSCILKLRSNQCFVCNFLCMPRCQCQIAPMKAQSLRFLECNVRNILTPIKIVCI